MFPTSLALRGAVSVASLTRQLHTGLVLQKARPGTRAKREAKKKALKLKRANVAVKTEFVPYKLKLEMEKVGKITPRRLCPEGLKHPVDNVYFKRDFIYHRFSVSEAVEMHRETNHPTQYNSPNGLLIAFIELSMQGKKKTQYLDPFSNVLLLPHHFHTEHDRQILAICSSSEMAEEATEAGASLAIGKESLKMIKNEEIDLKKYNHIVAHVSLIPELINFRSVLKRRMPSVSGGTAGVDIVPLITRFAKGIEYTVIKDKYDHDYASIEVPVGRMLMPATEIEKNLETILLDIETRRNRSARTENMITEVLLKCLTTTERILIGHEKYFPEEVAQSEQLEARKAA